MGCDHDWDLEDPFYLLQRLKSLKTKSSVTDAKPQQQKTGKKKKDTDNARGEPDAAEQDGQKMGKTRIQKRREVSPMQRSMTSRRQAKRRRLQKRRKVSPRQRSRTGRRWGKRRRLQKRREVSPMQRSRTGISWGKRRRRLQKRREVSPMQRSRTGRSS